MIDLDCVRNRTGDVATLKVDLPIARVTRGTDVDQAVNVFPICGKHDEPVQ
jgi:hypothetical protein